jgi:3-deoxy-D-manno-octulosonic acid kinase
MAPLLGDRYVSGLEGPRPLLELRASAAVRARGVPTPAVVAGAVYPAGLFYRADLVTELVPGGTDLRTVLFGDGGRSGAPGGGTRDGAGDGDDPAAGGPSREEALEAAGRLVRRMEQAGVEHPDLNAGNILLTGEDELTRAHLLDLDRCRVLAPGESAQVGPMRQRLLRSLWKLQRGSGAPLSHDELASLGQGFGEEG